MGARRKAAMAASYTLGTSLHYVHSPNFPPKSFMSFLLLSVLKNPIGIQVNTVAEHTQGSSDFFFRLSIKNICS
jgi:hypothetical protein